MLRTKDYAESFVNVFGRAAVNFIGFRLCKISSKTTSLHAISLKNMLNNYYKISGFLNMCSNLSFNTTIKKTAASTYIYIHYVTHKIRNPKKLVLTS